MSTLKLAIASDHAGYIFKERLKQRFEKSDFEIIDFGTDSEEPVDYPDFIGLAARAVSEGSCQLGIVLGGSGNGEAIVANKFPNIRCAVCWDAKSARLAKEHNDANIIALGQRMISFNVAETIVDMWLKSSFKGGRHERRILKIKEIENGTFK
jgi:ribose 5-phosphate isomerase B